MIAKKNPKYDFERKRVVFFQVGLITAGAMMLVAFRWGTPTETKRVENQETYIVPDELYEFIEKPEPKEPEPQVATVEQPTVQIITDEVNPVDDLLDDRNPLNDPSLLPPDVVIGKTDLIKPVSKFTDEPFDGIVEEMPEFVGGEEALFRYFNKHIVYPEMAKRFDDQGRVYVRFVVNEDGSISKAHVIKGVTEELNNEALRVVKGMPNWKPGKQRGRPVKVWFTVPIKFVSMN
jgi:periplasmic protein TonB